MSDDPALLAAYRFLDLPTDAQPLQVERAFRRKQALYAEGVLATYCLLENGTRQALLERLEAAYQKVAAACSNACRPPVATEDELQPEQDPVARPGHFLRVRREAAGMSVREVAERTKISPMKIIQIEEERYTQLPAPVYLRGFIVAYCRALGLPDIDTLVGNFLERQRQEVVED